MTIQGIDQLSIEVIKEQIRETRLKQKEENILEQKDPSDKITIGGAVVIFAIMFLSLVLQESFWNHSNFPTETLSVLFIGVLLTVMICRILVKRFRHIPQRPWVEGLKLTEELVEKTLGGEIISGTVGLSWSEITIDRKTHVLKVMARFTGEDQLDIETRKIVLDETI